LEPFIDNAFQFGWYEIMPSFSNRQQYSIKINYSIYPEREYDNDGNIIDSKQQNVNEKYNLSMPPCIHGRNSIKLDFADFVNE